MPEADPVVDYLKKVGLYATFAVAAGVASSVSKDATVGDVHVSTTIGQGGKGKKKPAIIPVVIGSGEGEPPAAASPAGDVGKADEIRKRIEAQDVVFSKGDANLYVCRPLTQGSAERLANWAADQGIQNVVPPELMHVTQVHSTAEVDTEDFKPLDTLIEVGDIRWLSQLGKGNALVMFFDSPEMQARFAEASQAGASWDFPTYMPHVTISYDTAGVDAHSFGMLRAPDVPLQLGPEEFKSDDPNWVADNGLVDDEPVIDDDVDGDGFDFTLKVTKAQPDKQLVFGWASITHVNGELIVDKQDDAIMLLDNAAGETGLESAAYDFTLHSREHASMHAKRDTGKLIESMVFTPEKEAAGIVAKNEKGETIYGWWTGFKISDPEVWKAAKEGHLPEFSIGGRATHVDIGETRP